MVVSLANNKHLKPLKMAILSDNDGINTVINFMYHITNFRGDFIQKVWFDDPHLATYLTEKFTESCDLQRDPTYGYVRWFYGLDRDNQRKLIKWISENYTSFNEFKY